MAAGFLFSINQHDKKDAISVIADTFHQGRYATLLSAKWHNATAATLGDYLNMRPGDNVYLFSNRTVYGIGEIVSILNNGDAAIELYDGATSKLSATPNHFISGSGDGKQRCFRWAVFFKPSPFFFLDGIDMDDLLSSNPDAFRSLRAFWKRSFIQLDDTENLAFKSALIRLNEAALESPDAGRFFPFSPSYSFSKIGEAESYNPISLERLSAEHRNSDGSLSSEMVLESNVLSSIKRHKNGAAEVFGNWDYLAHQVTASPFKPIEYMDRIDVFGYRWVRGYENEIISKFLVVELKKGKAELSDNSKRDYNQLMKYVDWVCNEYAHGDYSMIEAYLVAHSFDFENTSLMKEAITRPYVTGHQAQAHSWDDISFVKYYTTEAGEVLFERV